MAISKQFKSLNLKKMRKLCTDEVGGVKMKKMKKKTCFVIEKYICNCSFVAAPLALHSRDDW